MAKKLLMNEGSTSGGGCDSDRPGVKIDVYNDIVGVAEVLSGDRYRVIDGPRTFNAIFIKTTSRFKIGKFYRLHYQLVDFDPRNDILNKLYGIRITGGVALTQNGDCDDFFDRVNETLRTNSHEEITTVFECVKEGTNSIFSISYYNYVTYSTFDWKFWVEELL